MKKSIPTCKLDEFNKKLNFLNKRLTKYGKPPLEFHEINRYKRLLKFQYHQDEVDEFVDRYVEFANIEITGIESFKKDDKDYRFIGNIKYQGDIKQVSCLNEKYIEYFDRDYKICDHCHTNRYRKSYNLFEANGKVIQIGSSCSQDYFGYDVEKFLDIYLQTYFLVKEEDRMDLEVYRGSLVQDFVTIFNVIKNVTVDFTKWEKKQEDEYYNNIPSSVTKIRGLLFDIEQSKESNITLNKVPEATLERIRDYWNKQELSSFVINVCEALKKDYATYESVGFYSYAIFKAMQEIRRCRKEEAKKEGKISSYKEGERPTLNVTVVSHKIINVAAYGYSGGTETMAIVNFITDDGVRYMTKSTGFDVVRKIKAGDKLTIKGTVYGPNRYDELCYVLGRVKVLENKSLSHSNSFSSSHWDDNVITVFLKGEE